jgi:acetyl-CoA C-acetyltransferase
VTKVAIVAAARTPIGKFLGDLSPLSATDLGVAAAEAALARAAVAPGDVEEVILGQARQLGSGPNPARQVAIRVGCPEETPAYTVNKACGSSLKCLDLARDMRSGYRLGHADALDGNYRDGFTCAILKEPMGITAEYLADDFGIARGEQDEYALRSHQRAEAAQKAGRFAEEIVPVEISERKSTRIVDTDEHVRPGVTIEALAKLPPVFRTKNGTVHAGNSSGITDGAAALLVMTAEEAQRRGLTPLAFLGASAVVGCSPRTMGIGPVPAVRQLVEKTGDSLDDYDVIELNEAFAAQVIACDRELSMDMERVNVNGGAIALGHPIGATGARIVVTLLHEMRRRAAKKGLATLCMSGGMGMAMALHAP